MKPFHDPELESSKESPKKHPKDNILNITSNLKPNYVTKKKSVQKEQEQTNVKDPQGSCNKKSNNSH